MGHQAQRELNTSPVMKTTEDLAIPIPSRRPSNLKRAVRLSSPQLAIHGGTPVRTEPFPTWPQYGAVERRAVMKVFEANRVAFPSGKDWQVKGERRLALERAFAAFHNCRHGITTTSGTSALMVALRASGVMPGDEVLIQSYMCMADTEAIVQVGAVPVFCDIDRKNYGLDLARLEEYITSRTAAVIAIHFGGYMLDMPRLHRLASRRRIAVVEDASLAHGAEWNGKRVGNFSKLTAMSFGIDKLLTVGEGGIIVTNDDALADLCASLRNSGTAANVSREVAENRAMCEFSDAPRSGWNFRLTEIPSAIGLEGMKKLPGQIAKRHANGLYLDEHLKDIEGLEPLETDPRQTLHPHGLYLFRIDQERFGLDKETFITAANAEGIPALYGYHNPVYGYSVFRQQEKYGNLRQEEAERACHEGVWLSQAVLLGGRKDMEDIVRAFTKIRENVAALRGGR